MGLALALIRRVRELAFGIPGLIAWQIIEGSRAWKNTTSRIASPSFATGAIDDPPRLINTRPVSKGLHYKRGKSLTSTPSFALCHSRGSSSASNFVKRPLGVPTR